MPILKTKLPRCYQKQHSPGLVRILAEEEAIIWLWAKPSIFPWKRPLAWLFSPVTGKHRWPGDLWGIDSSGDLIILENKRGDKKDPFEDFVDYAEKSHDEITAKNLRGKWEEQYVWEKARGYCIEVLKGKQGIVPRSSHAGPLHRWPLLASSISTRIRGGNYPRKVRRWLNARERRGNPQPHYVGLVVPIDKDPPEVSSPGLESRALLQAQVGDERVHLFVARCMKTPGPRANAEISLSPYPIS